MDIFYIQVNTNTAVNIVFVKDWCKMNFLRFLGAFILLAWLIMLLLSVGGVFINLLLIIAAVAFITDAVFTYRRRP